jgi:GH35 family endo-1,4-beta-xylanase
VDFPVGVAIDSRETTGAYAGLLQHHFEQITPENHMKPEAWYDADKNFGIHPEAVALMDFAAANGSGLRHTLATQSRSGSSSATVAADELAKTRRFSAWLTTTSSRRPDVERHVRVRRA